jgi:intein/homing endonuclease
MSDNVASAENQQATLTRRSGESSETIRQAPFTKSEIIAYVHGAMHDGSLNKRNRVRIVQRHKSWLEMIRDLLCSAGIHSWIYREGKLRNLYALETVSKELNFKFNPLRLQTKPERIMYMRGFFDAEGGIPRNGKRFYIQLAQKDYTKMNAVKNILREIGIESGKIHNPSKRVDPNYWRIFIPAKYHRLFAKTIGSWHPVKSRIFSERMKI